MLVLFLIGCGAPARTDLLNTGQRFPRFELQGQCAPSTVSTALTVDERSSTCVHSLSAPTLIETQADFDALFDTTCEKPSVDFAAKRVLMLPARGSQDWFVFPNFLGERTDALEVGLVTRPQGFPPPDSFLLLPRTPATVELRWCHSVCVENCDVPIP